MFRKFEKSLSVDSAFLPSHNRDLQTGKKRNICNHAVRTISSKLELKIRDVMTQILPKFNGMKNI